MTSYYPHPVPLPHAELREVTCAHCGQRNVRPGDRDHLCVAALSDWLEGLRGTEHEPYTLEDLLTVLDELGV